MRIKGITREDEAKLPRFGSLAEARAYFSARYGDDAFRIEESFVVGEGDDATVIYRFALVLDRDAYEEGRRRLMLGSLDEGALKFLQSYQVIEVSLEGSVHVIH